MSEHIDADAALRRLTELHNWVERKRSEIQHIAELSLADSVMLPDRLPGLPHLGRSETAGKSDKD